MTLHGRKEALVGFTQPGSTSFTSDGFVLLAIHLSGAFADVVPMVIPRLQRGPQFLTARLGSTPRDHARLYRPRSRLGFYTLRHVGARANATAA